MVKNDKWLKQKAIRLGINLTLINPNSVDLRLGAHILEWKAGYCRPEGYERDTSIYGPDERGWFKKNYNLREGDEFFFYPDRFYLCHSREYVIVPTNKAAMLFLKSSAGREGLEHSHAGWVDSGFEGHLTWEITCHIPVVWVVGRPMCQLIYMEAEAPDKDYSETGRYFGQKGATEAKL